MYSSVKGAKHCAKQLKKILNDSGLIVPLAKCQAAVAVAGDFRDWHDLMATFGSPRLHKPPFDYWGRLIEALPIPCGLPLRTHLREKSGTPSLLEEGIELWVRDVLPYMLSLEIYHRTRTPLLRPGSGSGQQLRHKIVGGLLLNVEGIGDLRPTLDPFTLSIGLPGHPASLLPETSSHPRFAATLVELREAGILKIEPSTTWILGPSDENERTDIIARARSWNAQKEPEMRLLSMDDELATALRSELEIDQAESGPKVPYDQLDYRSIRLESRFSVAHEFETMKSIVDVMPEYVRLRIETIWCDSRACADYRVVVRLGMSHADLAHQIRWAFMEGSDGFNGLWVWHGDHCEGFDPEWPGEMENDVLADDIAAFPLEANMEVEEPF